MPAENIPSLGIGMACFRSKRLPVPVMLQMLQAVQDETHDDAVLGNVARTVMQAIDELIAAQRVAMEVMREMEGEAGPLRPQTPIDRRRLC